MQAFLCTNAAGAAAGLPLQRRCTSSPHTVAPAARISHRRRSSLAARGLRCAGWDFPNPLFVGVTVEKTVTVPFASLEQSLVPVDSVGDEALASKFGFKEISAYVMYGSGAFFAGWILSAVVSAIDSVPLLPKILEIVGLGYAIWFSIRYLIFKENRDELLLKVGDLKRRVIGSSDE